MDFEFFDEPALVEQKKKYLNFKITPIGGPEDIIKWREMQSAKESVYRMRLNQRNERLMEFETLNQVKLAEPTIHTTSWSEKKMFAESERRRLAKAEKVAHDYTYEEPLEPKPSVTKRITQFFKRIWENANL